MEAIAVIGVGARHTHRNMVLHSLSLTAESGQRWTSQSAHACFVRQLPTASSPGPWLPIPDTDDAVNHGDVPRVHSTPTFVWPLQVLLQTCLSSWPGSSPYVSKLATLVGITSRSAIFETRRARASEQRRAGLRDPHGEHLVALVRIHEHRRRGDSFHEQAAGVLPVTGVRKLHVLGWLPFSTPRVWTSTLRPSRRMQSLVSFRVVRTTLTNSRSRYPCRWRLPAHAPVGGELGSTAVCGSLTGELACGELFEQG